MPANSSLKYSAFFINLSWIENNLAIALPKAADILAFLRFLAIAYPPMPSNATGAANTPTPASIPPPIILPAAAKPDVIPAAEKPAVPNAPKVANEPAAPAPEPISAEIPSVNSGASFFKLSTISSTSLFAYTFSFFISSSVITTLYLNNLASIVTKDNL